MSLARTVLWTLPRPGGQKFEAKRGEGVIGSSQPATGSTGALYGRSPAGFGAEPLPQMNFERRTNSPENAPSLMIAVRSANIATAGLLE